METETTWMRNEENTHFVNGAIGFPSFVEASAIANILGDTILCQKPPLTVGVFGKWNSGKSQLLNRTRERMEKRAGGDNRSKKLSVKIFSLLYRLLFFKPILNLSHQDKAASYVFVHFSILDYAGCDRMWAGVITHISKTLDKVFGKWSVRLFRIWYHDPKHLDLFMDENAKIKTTKKRFKLSIVKFVVLIVILGIIATAIALWVVYGTPNLSSENGGASSSDVLTISLTTVVGFGLISHINSFFKAFSKLFFSQAQKITRLAKQNNLTKNLGFMDKVRTEIYYITSVLRYFGLLLDKNIRICLIVDDVDLLRKHQIMDLFQVVSLLHSSPNSVYVQILCMDPMIASNLIQKALTKEVYSNVSGHLYLKKHIQLPFFIPPINYGSYYSRPTYNEARIQDGFVEVRYRNSSQHPSTSIEMEQLTAENQNPIHEEETDSDLMDKLNKLKEHLLFDCKLAMFIDGNERAIKRVLISSQLALGLMSKLMTRDPSQKQIKELLAWITFVDQWPYRVSWIRQVVEDNIQLSQIDNHFVRLIADDARLDDVYHVVEAKLSRPKDWRNLIDLDGDPEAFRCFLQRHPFTVSDMKKFLPVTTNLNTALRRIIANWSANSSVQQKTIRNIEGNLPRWLQSAPIEKWTVEEVCFELERMRLSQKNLKKYQNAVKEKVISGDVLKKSSKNDLLQYFDMTPGDWNIFWMTIRSARIFQSAETTETNPE